MTMPPFQIRGVVEGFYGVYYTFPERDDLIRFLGQHGFNLYIYAPKNDRQHRNRWREPYPDKVMAQFAETIHIAANSGVTFCYALSPGVSMCYASGADFQKITDKFRAFYDLGVRSFSLLMDDLAPEFQHAEDRESYHSYAEAHADVCNRVYAWLKALDPACRLSMCPTDYHGSAPFSPYLHELGESLDPNIDIFYTGPEICSPTISIREVEGFAAAVKRPPIIWDNYPVNDLAMQSELHIGPLRGRDASLYEVTKGIVVPPMTQVEASKVPILTIADYMTDPAHYDPECSWEGALREVAGEESFWALRLLAENSLHSCLGTVEAEKLERMTREALAELKRGGRVSSPSVNALEQYLVELDEACYHLKNRMDNLALRRDLLPWIELLEYCAWVGLRALAVLKAVERGESWQVELGFMQEYLNAARQHHKRIADHVLERLAEYVLQRVAA